MRASFDHRLAVALAALCLSSSAPAVAQRAAHDLGAGLELAPRAIPADRAFVNAPVAPDTIYVARSGASTGISVVDLNGFGQSTGNPEFEIPFGPTSAGESRFPYNPNVAILGPVLVPPLAPGSTTVDGGSAGVFTLTENSDLEDLLIARPRIGSVGDMMLGHPLDVVLNNGAPFGCASGGGNLCATQGLQLLAVNVSATGDTVLPAMLTGSPAFHSVVGGGNPISFAPHPNPPPFLQVPLCAAPRILGQEPTSIVNALPPPLGSGLPNLLVPGANFLGNPNLGLPPSALLAREQNAFFAGPSPPQASIVNCAPYVMRQQIGHFLYAVDAPHDRVLVLNSNTFGVLARIEIEEPVELAMGPNLDFLAVTSRSANEVVFVDIDPASPTFHQVVRRAAVGLSPRGIAWDPGNEDVLVCNEGDGTVSVIGVGTLSVRKTLRGLDRPFAVAITPRQDRFGTFRNVYFAYVLERGGHVSLYESGPSGIGGWGFEAIIGRTAFAFDRAKAIQPDPLRLGSGVWIVHENQLDPKGAPTGLRGGAVSNLVLDSQANFPIPLIPGEPPSMRQLAFGIERSIGSDVLTGIPLDLAFDDQRNLGALPNQASAFSAGAPRPLNGKGLVRTLPGGVVGNTNTPALLFLPVRRTLPGTEVIDVIDLETGLRVDTDPFLPGIESIPAPGAAGVMDYFRQ